ncbi:MAG: serpin family protein [Selenomonadaceae bacterium]|nr:serpin family protein [Selenomonadaceae bacterium]
MKIFRILFLIIFVVTNSAACKAETRADFGELSKTVNTFSWNYFKHLDKDKNIFYSPYSIAAAFSIVANGASGRTQKEILDALSVKNVETLNDGFKDFRAVMENEYGEGRILKEADLILIDKKFIGKGINSDFEDVVKNVYRSEIDEADFSGNLDGEKLRIKNWVADNTDNLISDFESSVAENSIFDLLNVIYFKGDWENKFDTSKTWKSDFTNNDGSKSKVQMMAQTFDNKISYYADGKFMGIVLPYKKLDNEIVTAMYIILPRNENNLNVAESWNDEENSYKENFLANLKAAPIFNGTVEVFIPKFELDIKNKLNDDLKKMGIRRAFTNSAEFSNIIKKTQLKISSAIHQAKVKVDEEGTEAAAVTEITMVKTSVAGFSKTIYFRADRPFLFVIRDIKSEIDLFTGVVNLM